MKITYMQVQNKQFAQALGKLATHGGFTDYKKLANIKTFLKQFEKVSETAQKEWIELLKKYAQLDTEGNFVGQDGRAGTFIITPGKEMEFKTVSDTFNAKEADIWADTISYEEVSKVGLSAVDLLQLEGIIVEPKDFIEAPMPAATAAAN